MGLGRGECLPLLEDSVIVQASHLVPQVKTNLLTTEVQNIILGEMKVNNIEDKKSKNLKQTFFLNFAFFATPVGYLFLPRKCNSPGMILDTVEVAQGGGEALLIVLLGGCLAYPVCHTIWLNQYSIIWEIPQTISHLLSFPGNM